MHAYRPLQWPFRGGVSAQPVTLPPCGQICWHTLVKTLPFRNYLRTVKISDMQIYLPSGLLEWFNYQCPTWFLRWKPTRFKTQTNCWNDTWRVRRSSKATWQCIRTSSMISLRNTKHWSRGSTRRVNRETMIYRRTRTHGKNGRFRLGFVHIQ